MPVYHFDIGDTVKGCIGACAAVTADNEEKALERLKARLRDNMAQEGFELAVTETQDIHYIRAYINPDHLTVDHIDDNWED